MQGKRQTTWQKITQMNILVSLAFIGSLGVSVALAECPSDPAWLPTTPPPSFQKPPPHPEPDCGFYQPAWQTFLHIAQPAPDGRPSFLSYATIAEVFGATTTPRFAASKSGFLTLAPRALKGSNDPLSDLVGAHDGKAAVVNAGARQAGLNGLLVDKNGNAVFYAIHMNSTFVDFIRHNGLTTKTAVQSADKNLEFPTGAVELKSAWQIVPDGAVPENYITTRALVPMLNRSGDKIDVDQSAPPREVTVALLAIHVVFVLDKHPEFIWATFEHVDHDGVGDLAPIASALPAGDSGFPGGADGPISHSANFTLYKAETQASSANSLPDDTALIAAFDPAAQRFAKGGNPFQTSIFRRFPASKLLDPAADDDVVTLNKNLEHDFKTRMPADKRGNYRLVGAIWLDKPESFKVDSKIGNPPNVSPDDLNAPVAGEDGLSSMAMESFTQDSFVNCFSCHDTRPVRDLTGNTVLMPAKKLNVSHILSKFVAEQQ
jgi:hypothetical protein